MSGGGSATTTTQPPAYAMPYLRQGLDAAQDLYNKGPQTSDQTQAARDMVTQRATGGDPTISAAQNYAQQSLNGNFLNSNPYIDATFNQAALQTQNQLASQFAGSGRNVGASENNRSQQLNNLATQIYGGNYANERQLQQNTLGQAQGLGNQSYIDANALSAVGKDIDNQEGNWLDQYLGRVNSAGNGSTTTVKGGSNTAADIAGGALTLGGLLGAGSGGSGVLSGLGKLFGSGASGAVETGAASGLGAVGAAGGIPTAAEIAALNIPGGAAAGGAGAAPAAAGGGLGSTLAAGGFLGASALGFADAFGVDPFGLSKEYQITNPDAVVQTDPAGKYKGLQAAGGSGLDFTWNARTGAKGYSGVKWTNPDGTVITSQPTNARFGSQATPEGAYQDLLKKGAIGLPPLEQYIAEYNQVQGALSKTKKG